jgi:hypothetical protein
LVGVAAVVELVVAIIQGAEAEVLVDLELVQDSQ